MGYGGVDIGESDSLWSGLTPCVYCCNRMEESIIHAWLCHEIVSLFCHWICLAGKVTFILQDVVSGIKTCVESSLSLPYRDDLVSLVS